jgi:hypothetical protein
MRPGAVVATALACLPASEAASGDILGYHSQHSLIQCLYPLWGLIVGILSVYLLYCAANRTVLYSRSIAKAARPPCVLSLMFFLCVVRLVAPSNALGTCCVSSSVVPSNEVSSCTLAVHCNYTDSLGDQCLSVYPWHKKRVYNLSGAYRGRYATDEKIALHMYDSDSVCGAQSKGDFQLVRPGMAVVSVSNNKLVAGGNSGNGSLPIAFMFRWHDAYMCCQYGIIFLICTIVLWCLMPCTPSGQKIESNTSWHIANPPVYARQRRFVRTKGRRPSPIARCKVQTVSGRVFSTRAEKENKNHCKCPSEPHSRCTVSVSKTQYVSPQ